MPTRRPRGRHRRGHPRQPRRHRARDRNPRRQRPDPLRLRRKGMVGAVRTPDDLDVGRTDLQHEGRAGAGREVAADKGRSC